MTLRDDTEAYMAELTRGLEGEDLELRIGRALKALAECQEHVSASVEGCIPSDGLYPTKDAIRTYSLALMVELAEFVQTLDWKPWKSKPSDPERVMDEFADILAFLGVLLVYLNRFGISGYDLARQYRKKSIVNMERFLGQHGTEYVQGRLL